MAEEMADLMVQAFSGVEEVCSALGPGEWDLSTDCPGWSVKDCVSHLNGIERKLLGLPSIGVDVEPAPHVRNELGQMNEREVEARRPWPPERVLDEYRELTGTRAKALADLDAAAWDEEVDGVFGRTPRRSHIGIRVLDVFYHEQDIRRATGRPGHMGGAVARFSLERILEALPMVVAKRSGAPEGSVVSLSISPPGLSAAIEVRGGRGERVEAQTAPSPTARISTDIECALCLAGGRWTAEQALADGRAKLEGDEALGRRVLGSMVITP